MLEEQCSKLLYEILRVTFNRQETDPQVLLAQQRLFPLKEALRQKGVIDWPYLEKDLKLLKDHFYIELIPSSSNPSETKAKVFGEFVEPLADYITSQYSRKIDHGHYDLSVTDSKTFRQFDSQFSRQGLEWRLDTSQGEMKVSPIKTLDQLYKFINSKSRICFFDLERNIAQLYLYAAHQQSRLLGIWDAAKEPRALIPMWLMKMNGELPVLSLEFPLLMEEEFTKQKIYTQQGEEKSLNDTLLNLVLVYSLLQVEKPLPIIGTCRRQSPAYRESFRNLIAAAAERFNPPIYFLLRNKVKDQKIYSVQKAKDRPCTKVRFEGQVHLELAEDPQLLAALKSYGYRFETVLMFSQTFLEDKEREKTILYGDWGAMKGSTRIMPIKEYFRIRAEQEVKK